ncbi:Galectin-3 [Coprinopsis sp. MPI-PUGE-AT-0042]|nr:Galectin-3 [Coprinopsis sp. MPI-PUGE-AT-0042]
MSFLLRLRGEAVLKEPLKPNGIIDFQCGSVDLRPSRSLGPTGIDNTSINLLSSQDDILLHISIRRQEGAIVLNSCTNTEGWGIEERIPLTETFTDPVNPTITVYDHPDRLQLAFDYKNVHYYTKRVNDEVARLSYNINEGQTPVFSEVLVVNVVYFDDIMPRTY